MTDTDYSKEAGVMEHAHHTTSQPVPISEKTPLTLEMEALLEQATEGFTGKTVLDDHARLVPSAITYNPDSQRFEVMFQRKPAEWVRDILKRMHFGWNKFEGCWELYTWQARLYHRDDLADFLSALAKGIVYDVPEVPEGARRRWWKEVRDSPKQAIERLAEATQAERDSEGFGQLLKFVNGFKKYSWNNTVSILIQCPHATLVTGERKWNSLGRHVKWGEKPIIILGPRFKKVREFDKELGEWVEDKVLNGFLALPVYDISQTEGEPIPEGLNVPDIEGEEGLVFLEAMKTFCDEHGIKYDFAKLLDAGGYAAGREIHISNDCSINQQLSIMVHEVAHEFVHWDGPKQSSKLRMVSPKHLREVDAEGVAYVVCSFFNLPTTAPQYLARYRVTAKDIQARMKHIHDTASSIIFYLMEKTGWGILDDSFKDNASTTTAVHG